MDTGYELPSASSATPTRARAVAIAFEHASPIPPLDASTRVRDVSEVHFPATDADAFAIVEESRPIGLVTRQQLSAILFARFGHALYGDKPIAQLADRGALTVLGTTSLEEALRLAFARDEAHAYDDLVVVEEDGSYAGLLSVKRLVLHQTDMLAEERRRQAEVEARSRHLEEVASMKSRFLAAMTHELRAPLNTILGLGELLEAHHRRGRHDRVERHLVSLRTTATHLRALVDNILDQAKLEAGRMEVHTEHVDLRRMLEDVSPMLELLAAEGVDTRLRLPTSPATTTTDPVKVRQIVVNLVSNAAKFTARGSITLALIPMPGGFEVVVSDTGPGISVEDQALLFRPFTQLQKVETRSQGGTGLGLSLSRQMAHRIGAELRLESRLGEGTSVHLFLPHPKEPSA